MENKNNKILRISDYIQGAKLIWKEIAYGHKKDAVWLVALSLFIAICDGIVPLVSGRFFDSLSHIQENIFGVWITLSLLLLLTILSALGTDRKNTHGGWIGTLLYTEYIARSTKILFRLPMKFYNNTAVSELDQKMHRAANGVQNMFQNVILELLPAFLSIGVVFVTIISINLALSGVIILGVALYAIFLLRTIGNGALYTRNQADAWTKVWRERADGLYNIAIVKQSASEKHEDNKNDANLIDNATKNDRVLWQLWARVSIAQKIITLATQATVLIISVYMLRNGSLTPGQVIAFNAYVGMVFGPFLRLGNIWRHIQNNVIHITSANEILSTEPEKYSSPETIAQDIKGKVVFEDVSFWHDPRKKILDKLSFEAEAGSVVAFVGKTGAGKSSLTELIYRFHEIQKGKILIDDIPVEKFDLTSLRSQIGIVPQEPFLFDTTILNNVTYPNENVPMSMVETVARQTDLLEFIQEQPEGWETIVGERGVKLSGGQKQRVAIARAIIADPKILILDESTSALDAETQEKIHKSLEILMKGRTTFIIAHRLSAVRHADRIYVLHKGTIVESGTHDELMQIDTGRYRKLYELQYSEDVLHSEEEKIENE